MVILKSYRATVGRRLFIRDTKLLRCYNDDCPEAHHEIVRYRFWVRLVAKDCYSSHACWFCLLKT